jgi:hypothetical protein
MVPPAATTRNGAERAFAAHGPDSGGCAAIGYLTPIEAKNRYYRENTSPQPLLPRHRNSDPVSGLITHFK